MPHKTYTVATIAIAPSNSVEENTARIIEQVKSLKAVHPDLDLIVYGETILSPYIAKADDVRRCAQPLDGEAVNGLRKCCQENHVNLSIGMVLDTDGNIYNAQLLIDRQGKILSVHKKCNLTASERKVFAKGKTPVTYCHLEGITVATSICYDAFHPAWKGAIKEQDTHLWIHALADPLNPHFATGHNGRQTRSYYISANRYGEEGGTSFCGHIAIVSPWGRILSLRHSTEDVIIQTLKINLTPSKLIMLSRAISNGLGLGWHYLRYIKKVMDYLRWDRRMKTKKAS